MTSLTAAGRQLFLVRPEKLADTIIESKVIVEDGVEIVGFNFTPVKNQFDITVSSSSWESTGNAASLGSDSNTAISTQVPVTGSSKGVSILKNTVTMSDGQKIVLFVKVKVRRIESSLRDYTGD